MLWKETTSSVEIRPKVLAVSLYSTKLILHSICYDFENNSCTQIVSLTFLRIHLRYLFEVLFLLGYFQTGDALAIMPVIMFTKCIGVCMKSKTLENMLNHPKKRFTPLRDLPPRLKTKLFNSRNVGSYVGHFMDSLILLTYLGLLYMTPERIPTNRTQIVMLVSKEAILVDTTQSVRGYSKVSFFIFHRIVYHR